VDPGVGTQRQAILLETGGHRFIGPDNGLFSFLMDNDCLFGQSNLQNWRWRRFHAPFMAGTFLRRLLPMLHREFLVVRLVSVENLVQLMQPYFQTTKTFS
jgi:hypothetical protein